MADFTTLDLYCDTIKQVPTAAYVISTDTDFTIVYANPAFYQMIGYNKEELQYRYGNRLHALVSDDSLKHLRQLADQPQSEYTLKFEQRLRCSSSEEFWLSIEASYLFLENQPVIGCICHDISAQRNLELQVSGYQNTLQRVSEITHNEIFIYNLKTQFAEITTPGMVLSPVTEQMQSRYHGFQNALLSLQIVDPAYVLSIQEAFWAIQKGNPVVSELILKRSDGNPGWYRLSMQIDNQSGRQSCAIGIIEDISAQKETSLQYINQTQFFQAILSEKDAYAHIDVTMDVITRVGGIWNLYNELINKITYSQLVNEFIFKVVHPEDRKHYLEIMQSANFISSLENGIDFLGCQFRRIVEQNKMVWMELSVHLFKDPVTYHVLGLLSLKNIDELKRKELQAANKNELNSNYTKGELGVEESIRARLSCAKEEEQFVFIILSMSNFFKFSEEAGCVPGEVPAAELSQILSDLLRRDDIVGRYSEDEFILFLSQAEKKGDIERILKRLISTLESDTGLNLALQMGITLFCGEHSFEEIFRQADAALSIAKKTNKNNYYFYDKDHEAEKTFINKTRNDSKQHSNTDTGLVNKVGSIDDQSLFENMLTHLGDIAYLVNPYTFDLITGNEAFFRRVGLTNTQCIGLKCYEVMQNRTSPCPFCGKINWSKDKFYLWKNMSVALEQEFLLKNKMISWKGKDALLAIAVDISNNKSIVDSIDSSAVESHSVLNGIRNMISANSLGESMKRALEAIAFFFRADGVKYWIRQEDGSFSCSYTWRQREETVQNTFEGRIQQSINNWLCSREWNQPLMIESPEAMLFHSFELYELMCELDVKNLHWFPMKDDEKLVGVIQITEVSANFQNLSFMDAFSCFIISEQNNRALMDRLLYNHYHDDLTGLLSRNSYDNYQYSYDSDQLSSIGVVVADINDLKGVNKKLGFPMGDKLIKNLSAILLNVFHPNPVFRLNGDEFLVIIPETNWETLADQVTHLEMMIRENDQLSVSIGRSWDNIEKDLPLLIEQAIHSMQFNKRRYYEAATATEDQTRQSMVQSLIEDLQNNKYLVYLQPKINMSTGNLIGAEALIRFRDDEYGILPPARFIDSMERNNLIRYIDLFVFEKVCSLLKTWQAKGYHSPVISLNFSRQTLMEQDLVYSVDHIFEQYKIPKKKIEIEITESIGDMGKNTLYQAAHDFYHAGYSISLDDFGTKYTNLAILSELEFDTLKLDRSLVSSLEKQPQNQTILKHVIAMCHDLQINVIAEGVETALQEEILVSLGCRYGQGYLFGKPMEIEEFVNLYFASQEK